MLVSKLAASKSLEPVLVQDVFKTVLYTGNGSTQSINTGFNIKDDGGLVWLKNRSNIVAHCLQDTERGPTKQLYTTSTVTEQTRTTGVTSFDTSGFTLGDGSETTNLTNTSGKSYVSWSFKQQPKFFDVVTWTGDGNSDKVIPHNLESTPGFIVCKSTSKSGDWWVYHKSLSGTAPYIKLNSDAAQGNAPGAPAPVLGDVDNIYVHWSEGSSYYQLNEQAVDYVAYVFADDAGGFGNTGNDSAVKCGSYVGNGSTSGPTVTLGFSPQWILIKSRGTTAPWNLLDSFRGWDKPLFPSSTNEEFTENPSLVSVSSTGFQVTSTSSDVNTQSQTYLYVAIAKES